MCFFGQTKMEYLGCRVTYDGIRLLDNILRNNQYETDDYLERSS